MGWSVIWGKLAVFPKIALQPMWLLIKRCTGKKAKMHVYNLFSHVKISQCSTNFVQSDYTGIMAKEHSS